MTLVKIGIDLGGTKIEGIALRVVALKGPALKGVDSHGAAATGVALQDTALQGAASEGAPPSGQVSSAIAPTGAIAAASAIAPAGPAAPDRTAPNISAADRPSTTGASSHSPSSERNARGAPPQSAANSDETDQILANRRIPTPRGDYAGTIRAICDLVAGLKQEAGCNGGGVDVPVTLGLGMPGSISPQTGLVQNANSTWLNGRPFNRDLNDAMAAAGLIAGEVRCANDANCFALSEATDGAGVDAATLFGVIIGTGCGGGIVRHKQLVDGPRGIGGEWGHNPLPWPQFATGKNGANDGANGELPGPTCWCGRQGCLETWVSGPALAADHERCNGRSLSAAEIAAAAYDGDASARSTLDRHASRLARGLATVVNLIDPDVIVLGGGLSQMPHLYRELPGLIAPLVFADDRGIDIRPPRWGDASGVRGAARLWG